MTKSNPQDINLFIDGDAFPNPLKGMVFKAIERLKIATVVISNQPMTLGRSPLIDYVIVEQGPDEADDEIVLRVKANDLVITSDIPLADRIISKEAHVIDHRGTRLDTGNIKQRLAVRDLLQGFRDTGGMTKGPAPFGKKDAQQFANAFNRCLTQLGLG